ncbi:regulatory protein, Fis family [Eubacterium aggregans]|uniref:Regulatory protein, Fis family n=1 Tax=Eubacterium aggregans TaxID=81409 RepID=A0A1H3XZW3_9FIRM|nr:helix-turn-helix domain-containing protein [Eubacterium aggregans]SEA04997.1 regulatory protein, Fis family [Eubacterium aggregans]
MFDEKAFKISVIMSGVTMKQVAEHLGINEATLYRKIKRDGDFSRKEINDLIPFLKIENPFPIFFA